MTTSYTAETPWLCWDKWARLQTYHSPNPPWYREPTSIWTNPGYRKVWEPHGDAGIALIWRLTHHMAARSTIGVVWGDPVALQRELGMATAPDLSWLLDAGWLIYISDAEKAAREHPPAEAKTEDATDVEARTRRLLAEDPSLTAAVLADKLGRSVRSIYRLRAWRDRQKTLTSDKTEERRAEESKGQTETLPSGAPARAPLTAPAAPPETETEQRQAQEGPRGPSQLAGTLALVSSLPQPVPAHLGLPGGVVPPESDARGVGRARARNPPPASSPRRGPPRLLGDCLGPLAMAESCPDVWDWVSSVYRLLRFPWPINSAEGRRETGSFAAMYNRVMAASLPMGERTKILVSSLKTAEQKGRKPQGYYRKGKGAVFCEVLNRRLKTHLARDG